ncbi:DAK2 domain-containing protein [Isoptericola sp. b408]|uniref:DAK2 domain-containing protein n=1 Tax=Isoptericola sp. b408 TaxID=3064653 RepID=UPI002713B1C4|nr:DAK2 domain-containing protein [Isoptericola sp. b408]MDO8150969.1 DAK2 domain-containing protein [Isoptericola sp. b408]
MDQPELLDAVVVRTWAHTVVEALDTARPELDGVNVFPVADGDTGTNMYLTVREAAGAVHDADAGSGGAKLLRVAARAALLGARGNSGVILSEWLRGFAVAASRQDTLGVGLDVAARSARRAVAHPMPGTILTAADAAAAAARHAEAGGMVGPLGAPRRLSVLDAARRGAREAALRSVGSLAPLRDAGVLDAGACGLVLVLASLAAAQQAAGEAGVSPEPGATAPVLLDMDLRGHAPVGDDVAAEVPADVAEPESGGLDEVELMFVLHRSADADGFVPGAVADALRADLDRVGNSVVVVGGSADDVDSLWQAHVHAPDLDAALAVPRRWAERGAISHVHVRHLAVPPTDWAVVVTTSAPALAAELATGGAVVLLDLDTAPAVDDLAQAAVAAGTPNVLVMASPELLEGLDDAIDDLVARDVAHGGPGDQPRLAAVPAPDDVHLVTAVSALAGALDAVRAGGDALDVPGVVLSAHRRLRADRVAAADAATAVARLVEECEDPGIVAVLPDADVGAVVLGQVVDRAAACAPGADVVVLATGRPGDRVGIGVEPVEDVVDDALLPLRDGGGR